MTRLLKAVGLATLTSTLTLHAATGPMWGPFIPIPHVGSLVPDPNWWTYNTSDAARAITAPTTNSQHFPSIEVQPMNAPGSCSAGVTILNLGLPVTPHYLTFWVRGYTKGSDTFWVIINGAGSYVDSVPIAVNSPNKFTKVTLIYWEWNPTVSIEFQLDVYSHVQGNSDVFVDAMNYWPAPEDNGLQWHGVHPLVIVDDGDPWGVPAPGE
jgi:hypothetical protein